jgi:hypothetical protein
MRIFIRNIRCKSLINKLIIKSTERFNAGLKIETNCEPAHIQSLAQLCGKNVLQKSESGSKVRGVVLKWYYIDVMQHQ